MIVTSKKINGISAQFIIKNENEHIQKCWKAGSFYESHRNGILAYMLSKGSEYQRKKCLDIGASIGNHTLFFSKILQCEVVSFEPEPSSFSHLKENCELNGIAPKLHNVGLGAEKGTSAIVNNSNSKDTYNVGMFQLVEGDGIVVEALDDIFEGQVDFIKIDVEHYNVPLLKGAKKVLMSQRKCDVFIECESTQMFNDTNQIMTSYGYRLVKDIVLNHTPTYLWKK